MQRYFALEKKEDLFELSHDDIRHITLVMRMETGDHIEIVYNHNVYICCIENVNKNVKINIEKQQSIGLKKTPFIILAVPLLKEQKMDLILQKSTELGVDKIIPILTERSIIKLEMNKEAKKMDRWIRICKEASEQSKRTNIPEITNVKTLLQLHEETAFKFVCSTVEEKNTLKKALKKVSNCDRILLVMGPEGGLSQIEEDTLHSIGFESITLGEQIMRVETVPLYLLSTINYEYME